MNIYLVQHALARDKEEDPQRSLSDPGRAQAEQMARYAGENLELAVARIWNSGKRRARQTAEIFAEHLKPPLGVREGEHLGPMDDPQIWADRLAEMTQEVMIVGHLPHLQRLASALLIGDPLRPLVQFENAGIVCLSSNESGDWTVAWAHKPWMIAK